MNLPDLCHLLGDECQNSTIAGAPDTEETVHLVSSKYMVQMSLLGFTICWAISSARTAERRGRALKHKCVKRSVVWTYLISLGLPDFVFDSAIPNAKIVEWGRHQILIYQKLRDVDVRGQCECF